MASFYFTVKNTGFTLIELIVVVLILGVLAVSALPKISSTGFSAVTERDQLISLLRTVQSRAMQNTQNSSCQAVNISLPNIGMAAQNNDGSCSASFLVTPTDAKGYLNIELENSFTAMSSASPSLAITQIEFDDLGRPTPDVGSCAPSSCKITIASSESVCIESQGYIHACP